jgi:D-alanyl-D-alanine carboxypeptidase (penicillin-binding protein 5/6)
MASLAAVPSAGAAQAAGTPIRVAHAGQQQPARRDVGGPRMASRGIVVNYPSRRAPRLPSVPASAYVIANASTGQVLAAKDPHGRFPPASTLKVLTAITMIPRLNPNAWVLASPLAASVEPNVVGLIPGHRYKVADLFRALLLISANDAAVALVQASGSFHRGMALMNAQAHRLQAYDVVAKQPNGLPAAGQVVSAYDEALIARQALALPAFMHYDQTLTASFPLTRHKSVTLVNQNYLLTKYRGGIGGKIGWTIASEATYIGLARRHGVTLIVTILHCTALQEITSAERLLNWGFSMVAKVRPVGVLVPPLRTAADSRAAARRKSATRPQHVRANAAQLRSALPGEASGSSSGLAIGAGIAAAAVIGIGGLARSRRRSAVSGRHRPG